MKQGMLKRLAILAAIGGLVLAVKPTPAAWAEDEVLQDQLSDIQSKLKDKQAKFDELQEKIDVYNENIKSKQQEALTLNSQLEVIDQDIGRTQAEIDQTGVEIDTLTIQVDGLQIKINDTEEKIDTNQENISKLIREMYDYDQQTYLEIALSHNTLSEYSSQVEYTETVNQQFQTAVQQLRTLKDQLKQDKQDANDKKQESEDKKQELETHNSNLQGEAAYKGQLLEDIEGDEEKFQQLVNDIKAEQDNYNAEISSLEKSARQTLDKLGSSTTPTDDTATTDALPSEFDPIWPVNGVVTTLFHDPDYIFRRYFEHDAIDIAAPQGTALKAVDSGVVAVVRFDGSTNYAYVMVVHADNFASIYGHVSAVYVQPDQVVEKGQTIAAVGGLPGTPGAGPFTTGSHVHFGIRLNGIPVDPLSYLP